MITATIKERTNGKSQTKLNVAQKLGEKLPVNQFQIQINGAQITFIPSKVVSPIFALHPDKQINNIIPN